MDPSGPKAPPEIRVLPEIVLVKRLTCKALPEVTAPNMPVWVKFQAKWMVIGNHRFLLYTKAAPSKRPPSTATAKAEAMVLWALSRCRAPKIRAERASAR